MDEKIKFSKTWYLVGILLAANLVLWFGVYRGAATDYARVYFFDVGQGDAIFLRTPQGNDVLIDGGPSDAILGKLGKVMPFYDRTIELLVLTHPHADHVSGLVEVLKRYRVKQALVSEIAYDSSTYQVFLDLLKQKNVPIVRPHLGMRFFLDEETLFDVYYPLVPDYAKLPSDLNDTSIVLRFAYGRSHALFTGDAGKDVEAILERTGLNLSSDVLKIGHHGSELSTSAEFLNSVSPKDAVITVGKNNSYQFPREQVLGILASANVDVLRTDERGDIAFRFYPDRVVLSR